MSRRAIVWLLSVPLMLAGTEVAHWLAFRLVYPDPMERSQALQQSGHGYFALLPVAGGIAAALLVSALLFHGRKVSRGRTAELGPVRLSQFAALPPLAFALQEHLESLIHSGTVTGVVLEPTFMLGLLLQLPFAVVAYLVARLLLRVARRVGRALARDIVPRPRLSPVVPRAWTSFLVFGPRVCAMAGGHAERGPPL